jgi:multidrug transporter EmrE-like cation transporter
MLPEGIFQYHTQLAKGPQPSAAHCCQACPLVEPSDTVDCRKQNEYGKRYVINNLFELDIEVQILLLLVVSLVATLSQILMKLAARTWVDVGTLVSPRVVASLFIALSVALAGQLLWLYVLKTAPLSTSYAFLALVFLLVPIAGTFFFEEDLSAAHIVSIAFIVIGVAIQGFASR